MAESQATSATAVENHDSQTKQVQEIAADYNHPPERYIRKQDEEYGNVSNTPVSSPMSEVVPVIDISLLTSSLSELHKLKSSVSSWGCFQVSLSLSLSSINTYIGSVACMFSRNSNGFHFRQLTMELKVHFWRKLEKSANCSSDFQGRRRRNT